ncbi:SpoIIE family protein phosphatase [Kineococcus terrestris]|uniref:SpoIIE family protein phosphatase n=1 Tax=Kineococcus terrestris TaxID=2044856 RepID=UPI0034DB7699
MDGHGHDLAGDLGAPGEVEQQVEQQVEREAARLRWQLAITAAGIGGFDWDLVTGRLSWDDRLVELFGYERSTFAEDIAAFDARLHPDDRARVSRAVDECIATCGTFEAEYRVVRPDGTTRWVQARGKALAGPSGRAVRMLGAAYDTTAERDADARTARVLESMPTAFFSLDRDWRFSYVNARAEELLGRARGELLGGDVWELFPAAVGAPFDEEYHRAVDTGEPVAFEAYYPAPLDAWFEVRAWPTPDGLSVYFIDVTARRRAVEAVEAARAEAERERVRTAAAAERLRLLASVGDQLGATLDAEEAVARLAQTVVPVLADWCVVTLVDEHGGLRDVGSWHRDPAARELVRTYAAHRLRGMSPNSFVHQALRTEQAVLVERDAAPAVSELLAPGPAREVFAELAPESMAVLPLRARGRTSGLVTLFRGPEREPLRGQDALTAGQVADRAGLALDNARLYAEQQHIAEGLQRSLLTALVDPEGADLEARYLPAAAAAQVGGDWYDAFRQRDGRSVLVIGDVMGHDVSAAAAMGQLRSLLRGIAHATDHGPAQLLTGLDAAMRGLAVDTTATALVARLERGEGGAALLRWSSAGHPPPLLLRADGTCEYLETPVHELLLGIDAAARRTDRVTTLAGGDTLLLFTDGLVERRGQSVDEGLRRLRAAVAGLRGAGLPELCSAVLERLVPQDAEDDVALLAVRLHP